MGMAALGNHKLVGGVTIGHFLWTSQAIGGYVQRAGNWMREPMGSEARVVRVAADFTMECGWIEGFAEGFAVET